MKKNITLICILAVAFQSFSQIKVGKAMMDYEVEYGGESLKMNGAGIRSKFFVDLYSAALYLKEKSKDPIAIAYDDETMAIKIKITSKLVSRNVMLDAIEDGFRKAVDSKENTTLDSRIGMIRKFYLKELAIGDQIDLVYVKDEGIGCYMNGEKLGVIEGQDFKFALYKIWLGEDPASKSLKKGMLGKA